MSSVSPACFLNWTLQPNYYLILTEYILYKHSPSHSANTLVVLVAALTSQQNYNYCISSKLFVHNLHTIILIRITKFLIERSIFIRTIKYSFYTTHYRGLLGRMASKLEPNAFPWHPTLTEIFNMSHLTSSKDEFWFNKQSCRGIDQTLVIFSYCNEYPVKWICFYLFQYRSGSRFSKAFKREVLLGISIQQQPKSKPTFLFNKSFVSQQVAIRCSQIQLKSRGQKFFHTLEIQLFLGVDI